MVVDDYIISGLATRTKDASTQDASIESSPISCYFGRQSHYIYHYHLMLCIALFCRFLPAIEIIELLNDKMPNPDY